jgi:hypothetical protein
MEQKSNKNAQKPPQKIVSNNPPRSDKNPLILFIMIIKAFFSIG